MEEYEYISLKLLEAAINQEINTFLEEVKKYNFDELLRFVSKQETGRGGSKEVGENKNFEYKTHEVVRYYQKLRLGTDVSKYSSEADRLKYELRWKIASAPFFSKATEHLVYDSITKYLLKNNIGYKHYYSPNASDFAIIIEKEDILKLIKLLDLDITLPDSDYNGIVMHVDAKSVSALLNLNDRLVKAEASGREKRELGQCTANWNQISYIPKKLEGALRKYDDEFKHKKHEVLPQFISINSSKYYTVTNFVSCLSYLPKGSTFFKDDLDTLDTSYFSFVFCVISVPNGILKDRFYDEFFGGVKNGYDKTLDQKYPFDSRIYIKSSKEEYLVFKNMAGTPNRFFFISDSPGEFDVLVLKQGKVDSKKFVLGEFTVDNIKLDKYIR